MGKFSLFSNNKNKVIGKLEDKSKIDHTISFVLCDSYDFDHPHKLLSRYNDITNKDYQATDINYENNTVTFKINDELGFISFMPAPFPWEDLEGPCATSWMWPQAKENLRNHKRHIIVSWMAKTEDQILKSTIISKLTASVLEEVNGVGVYWGNSSLVNKKDVFCGMVYDIDDIGLPLFLWIDFRLEKNSDGTLNMITHGLKHFGVMEIEIIRSSKDYGVLIDFTLNIARYLISNGNVIKDGDTLGEYENQKILATHEESIWINDNRGLVLRVNY